MKTLQDPRHIERALIIQDLFSHSFHKQRFKNKVTKLIFANLKEIDHNIETAAVQWPLDKIAKVDLAILRLALYELLIKKETPKKVIIDEAVELAKEFGGEGSPPFINGVLGKIINN